MRIALDTNVVVSGFLWVGNPRRLIEAILDEQIEAFSSEALLAELLDVSGRAHLAKKMAEHQLTPALLIERYRAIVELVNLGAIERVVDDPDDDVLIATAIAARAQIVVSGDKKVLAVGFHRGIEVLGVNEAMRRIEAKGKT